MGQKIKGKINRGQRVDFTDTPGVMRVTNEPMKPIKLRRRNPQSADDLTPRSNLPKRSLPAGYQAKGKKPGPRD